MVRRSVWWWRPNIYDFVGNETWKMRNILARAALTSTAGLRIGTRRQNWHRSTKILKNIFQCNKYNYKKKHGFMKNHVKYIFECCKIFLSSSSYNGGHCTQSRSARLYNCRRDTEREVWFCPNISVTTGLRATLNPCLESVIFSFLIRNIRLFEKLLSKIFQSWISDGVWWYKSTWSTTHIVG